LLKDELSRASQEPGAEQYKNVPPCTGMLSCVQYVGGGPIPREVLYDLEETSQGCRAYARTDTGKNNRQPEARCAWAFER
jgi:hypothetical protein